MYREFLLLEHNTAIYTNTNFFSQILTSAVEMLAEQRPFVLIYREVLTVDANKVLLEIPSLCVHR